MERTYRRVRRAVRTWTIIMVCLPHGFSKYFPEIGVRKGKLPGPPRPSRPSSPPIPSSCLGELQRRRQEGTSVREVREGECTRSVS